MLNRRILRTKAFKTLFSFSEDRSLSLKDCLALLEISCEATRDLYLFMLAGIQPLTSEANRRIEAGLTKFNPTEEERNPNRKFAENAVASLLAEDPDFQKLIEKKKLSWEPYDVLVRNLFDTIREKDYFKAYMAAPGRSLKEDARLFKTIFENEFEDNEELAQILEEMNIYWIDDLGYVLRFDIKSMDEIAKTGRWTYPGLSPDPTDHVFVSKLVQNAVANYDRIAGKVAANVSQWEADRLFNTDIALIVLGVTEAETFEDIPVRATINEYVELTKYYSTPKSRSFVNGLLDRLIKEEMDAGKIAKRI